MAERIYTIGDEGGLEPLEEAPFSTEDKLQALVADHPELLDGEQIRPGDPRRWILITREKGVAEKAGAQSSVGSTSLGAARCARLPNTRPNRYNSTLKESSP